MLVDQGFECLTVTEGEFADHGQIGCHGRFAYHLFEVVRQCIPGIQIDGAFEHCGRLVPRRGVVVVGYLVKAESQIVIRADPVRRIQHPGLHRGVDLTTRHIHRGHSDTVHGLASQARQTQFHALQIIERIDLFLEPATRLRTGIAYRERLEVVFGIDFVPQLLATAMVEPGIGFSGGHAKGHSRKKLRGSDLAAPIVGSRVSHLGSTGRYRIEHFHGRHQLTGAVHANTHAASRQRFDAPGELIGPRAQRREVGGPRCDHIPGNCLLRLGRGDKGGGDNTSGTQAGGLETVFQKKATLHKGVAPDGYYGSRLGVTYHVQEYA